jgi:cytochrome c551/c552
MIGPSYQEIAAKYSDKDIELLASKIIEGGSGVWAESLWLLIHRYLKKMLKKWWSIF